MVYSVECTVCSLCFNLKYRAQHVVFSICSLDVPYKLCSIESKIYDIVYSIHCRVEFSIVYYSV